MGRYFYQHRFFLIPTLLFIAGSTVLSLSYPKGDIHLYLNGLYASWADVLFKYGTHLGDGLIFLVFILGSLFFSWRQILRFALAALLTLLVSGGLKSYYHDEPRPVKFFEGKQELRLVEGVKIHSFRSFPSGHTIAAFAAWGVLALSTRRRWWQLSVAAIAILVGYSRIYLSLHFLRDVATGALLGTIIAFLAVLLVDKWQSDKLDRKPLAQKL
jgi:membrane-associated phospholipid phosphatase